jgi:hypothetical protein
MQGRELLGRQGPVVDVPPGSGVARLLRMVLGFEAYKVSHVSAFLNSQFTVLNSPCVLCASA